MLQRSIQYSCTVSVYKDTFCKDLAEHSFVGFLHSGPGSRVGGLDAALIEMTPRWAVASFLGKEKKEIEAEAFLLIIF